MTVSVSNTHKEVMHGILDRLNFGTLTEVTHEASNRKTKYSWSVRRYDQCIFILRLMRPFLTIKAARADTAIELAERKIGNREAGYERNREIVRLVESGKTHHEVGQIYGIGRTSVTQVIAAAKRGHWRREPAQRLLSSHSTFEEIPQKIRTNARVLIQCKPPTSEHTD